MNRREKSDLNLIGLKETYHRCTKSLNTTAVKILNVQKVYIAVKFLLSWHTITPHFGMSYAVETNYHKSVSITKCPIRMARGRKQAISNIWKHTNAHSLTVSRERVYQKKNAGWRMTLQNCATALTFSHKLMNSRWVGSSQSSQSFS